MLGVLNNISSIYAQNNLNNTQMSLESVLNQLSSGMRINSGADDAAGLALADGLEANVSELAQSAQNASQGVGYLQTADGALSQVNSMMNRAVTLATESANGTLNTSQLSAANQEYQSILGEISNIGSNTQYNGINVFGGSVSIFTNGTTDTLSIHALSSSAVGDANGTLTYAAGAFTYTSGTAANSQENLSTTSLGTATAANTAIAAINIAVTDVAAERGYVGSQINLLNATSGVMTTEDTNLTSASNNILATDYSSATSEMSKYEILMQTGISALAQANSTQQMITKLLQ
jgi:flagellin